MQACYNGYHIMSFSKRATYTPPTWQMNVMINHLAPLPAKLFILDPRQVARLSLALFLKFNLILYFNYFLHFLCEGLFAVYSKNVKWVHNEYFLLLIWMKLLFLNNWHRSDFATCGVVDLILQEVVWASKLVIYWHFLVSGFVKNNVLDSLLSILCFLSTSCLSVRQTDPHHV